MRWCLVTLLFFIYSTVSASEKDTAGLWGSVASLNTALVRKDTIVLKRLLHDKLSYGHSNGWTENKSEVMGDLYNGTLTYKEITQDIVSWYAEQNMVFVRVKNNVDVALKGKEIKLKLFTLQVWIKDKKHWKLISRQSTKID